MLQRLVLIFLITSTLADYEVPPPNLGDVRLENPTVDNSKDPVEVFGNAQIYSNNGGLSAPSWSNICYDTFRIAEATVLCRQIGYLNGRSYKSLPSSTGSYPTWFQNVTCSSADYSHILNCHHDFKENITACTGTQDIAGVTCTNPMIQDENSIYSGQIMLCPPDSTDGYQEYPNISASFGIISLSFNQEWGGITVEDSDNPSKEITRYRGDLICQQMGYQQMLPGSINSLTTLLQYSPYTFDGCMKRNEGPKISHAWIKSENLRCKGENNGGCPATNTSCFGCCYEYPDKHLVSNNHFIIIQCMYDPYYKENFPVGNKSACSFDSDASPGDKMRNYHSVCESAGSKGKINMETVTIVMSVLFGAFVLFCIIAAVISILCCEKLLKQKQKCKGYCRRNEEEEHLLKGNIQKSDQHQSQEDQPSS